MSNRKRVPRTRRCYNSGKIGGLPYAEAYNKFRRADDEIYRLGLYPVNPTQNGLSPTRPWWMQMVVDLWLLCTCGSIYLQRDWAESRGARIELRVARWLGLTVWEQPGRTRTEK